MEVEDKADNRLPRRLFATDRYPCNRLNIYSKPDYLPFIRKVLKDTEEFDLIKASCFGKLFDLPARQCPVSAKLIHSFLTRQIICEDNHTLWSVFGGKPLRFGLQEFGSITGLPCGAFPPGYNPDTRSTADPREDPFWVSLIGKKRFTTIEDLAHKLETDRDMSGWKKLRLALIIIVDGVLIAHEQKTRPTLKFVKMLEDLQVFYAHPWGRESFLKTINCMKPPKFDKRSCKDPPAKLVEFLKQESYRLKGFPLSLQLLAFEAAPKLLSIIQAPNDTLTILDLVEDHLPNHPPIATLDIHGVEADPKLAVTPLIPLRRQSQPGWGIWPDVCNDEKVSYMEERIADRQPFTKAMWPGGDTSEDFITFPHVPVRVTKKKRTSRSKKPATKKDKLRQCIGKASASNKQRRISTYFSRATSSKSENDQVLEVLSNLSTQIGELQSQFISLRKHLRRRKPRSSSKRSSFHDLLQSSKTSRRSILQPSYRSDKGCQTEPTLVDFNDADHSSHKHQMEQDSEAMTNATDNNMDVDGPSSISPLISQYAAHQYSQHVSTTISQLHEPTFHNQNHQTTPVHSSPVHVEVPPPISPVQATPVHTLKHHQTTTVHNPIMPTEVCTPISPVQDTPVHTINQHQTTPVHNTQPPTEVCTTTYTVQETRVPRPQNEPSPVHNTPVHKLPTVMQDYDVHNQASDQMLDYEGATASAFYDTSAKDHVHNSTEPTPTTPPYDGQLFSDPNIPTSIKPNTTTPTLPKYDSSAGPASRRACLFPFSTSPSSPVISPTKCPSSLPGFSVHAAVVNAFSANATSQLPVTNNKSPDNEAPVQEPLDNSEIVELSDGDDTPKRMTSTYLPSIQETKLAKQLLQCKAIPAASLISELPQIQWDLFYNTISHCKEAFHITPSNLSFSNNFLLQLAVPKQWTKTYHMVMLMHMLSERNTELLQSQRLCFTTPYLTSGIQEMYRSFSRSRKKDTFTWDRQLSDIVLMPGRKWMVDVTTVYTPMIWADKHWVGLAINLDLGLVEILDPMIRLYSDSKVTRFMTPVLRSLPYLVKKVAKFELTQFRKLEPFTWIRNKDCYCNERSGDCGPVSVKFMEMHAHGDPEPCMSGITDKMVDEFRKQYVLDLYKTIVLPTYYK